MLSRSLKRYLFLIPAAIALLLFSTDVWFPQPVIVPLPHIGFIDTTEGVIPLLLLLVLSFTLHDNYEIELGLVCGVRTTKLAFSKAFPIILYTLFSTWIIILCHRYVPYTSEEYKIYIPIYVPENYKIYLLISSFVTILFFSVLFFFLRVLVRNCYVPVVVGLFLIITFDSFNLKIRGGDISPAKCWMDPFISTYFIGDTIPNAMAEHYTDLTSLANAWTYNRLTFFALAILLLVATWLLLRREKLHEGFGD